MSRLEEKLSRGEFAVTAEIGPPKSASGEDIVKRIRAVKGYADAYNVTDNQTATVRMSSLAGCVFCIREGVEPVMQITCRDRNRIAIQSDVLGACALGVGNVLCISGDHQSFGNQRDSRNVFDIDSTQELMILKKMRDEGRLWSGDRLLTPPRLFLGAAANPFGDPAELHMLRLRNKILAGAQFVQTQSVFDLDAFDAWMDAAVRCGAADGAKILVGVLPLKSAKAAGFMADSVPGTRVPEALIRRISSAPDEAAEGLKIAVETVEHVRGMRGVAGVHLMPVNWSASVPEVCERAGLLSGP